MQHPPLSAGGRVRKLPAGQGGNAMRALGRSAVALVLLAVLWSQAALAQAWPTKPVRLVVAYPPGGPTDLVGRLYAAKLSEAWGQPVVVENRPGANGNIAAQAVAKSAPDGQTFLLHASSLVINSLLYKAPGYDPMADFTPIALAFDYKLIVVVHPSRPITSLAELVAAAKAEPGKLTFASAGGVGAPTHLAVELFKQRAGIDMVHVPYAGGAPAVNDLLAGIVDLMFNNPTQSLPYIKSGKLRGLATTGLERMAQAPELPTVAESGYPGFDVGTWFAFWAPAGLPPAIATTMSEAVGRLSRLPEIREQLAVHGLNPLGSTPAALAEFMRAELERWSTVLRAANIKPE